MATQRGRVRVVGSGYTIWKVNGQPLLYGIEVSHRSPSTVAQAVEIHPLNYIRPVEIVTPRAITHGEIVMNVVELYGKKVWDSLLDANGNPLFDSTATDLADIMNQMAALLTTKDGQSTIQLQRLVKTVYSQDQQTVQWILTTYSGVKIIDVREDETTRTETMQNQLQITCWYTAKSDEKFDVSAGSSLDDNPAGHLPDELSYTGK